MLDVGYITYREKSYPVRISYIVLKKFKAETGKKVEEANDDMASYEALLYLALERGAKYMDKEFGFKQDDMEEVLDECFWEFLELIPKFFIKDNSDKSEDTKKKTQKKKS